MKPTFHTPADVLALIKDCVDNNTPERLYVACVVEIPDFWKEHIFHAFRDIERAETLAQVFLDHGQISAFPEGASLFKLGGHRLDTHHLHLDLVQSEGLWYLQKIWVCR